MEEIGKIFQLYETDGGKMDALVEKLKNSQMDGQKASKESVRNLLIFFLTTGIAKIYKISNNLDKFSGCSWKKFQKYHKQFMKSLTYKEKKMLLKLGIYDSISNNFVMIMCDKMGLRYKPIGYPKWIK